MTGELFQLLSHHSILASSMFKVPATDDSTGGFLDGVQQGIGGQMAAKLFTIRSADLLGLRSNQENARFLSGLLIGSELACLQEVHVPVWIAASAPLDQLYRIAIENSLPEVQAHVIDSHVLEAALLAGHREILRATITG